MSGKDITSSGSESVSKRKFLKKIGVTAGALSTVSLVENVQADNASNGTVTPESCSTETLRSGAEMRNDALYCNPVEVGGYSAVKVNLSLSDDPNGETWGEFKANMDASDNSCDGPWDRQVEITDSGHSFYFNNPTGQLTIRVDTYGGSGTFDLEIEKCF